MSSSPAYTHGIQFVEQAGNLFKNELVDLLRTDTSLFVIAMMAQFVMKASLTPTAVQRRLPPAFRTSNERIRETTRRGQTALPDLN